MWRMTDSSDWTVEYFDEPYTELHPFPDAAQTGREVETLAELLPPVPARILDVACGPGRHAVGLARRGYQVVGIDSSTRFLAAARASANELAEIEFLECDMRSLRFEAEFDAALSLFTAWGYFDDTQNQQVLDRVARALRPGGRLIMELASRDRLMRVYAPRDFIELQDGSVVAIERTFDPVSGVNTVTNRWRTPTGELRQRQHRVRVYTPTELNHMLRRAGLGPVAWYGDWSLTPLTLDSRRMLVIAEQAQ
jgi:SAM-dependent methyltransferase